jgi:predicted alpha/beta hydrolase family esterase
MSAPPYALLLHGYTGAGPGHWQGWLAGRLAHLGGEVDVPTLSDPDRPVLATWLAELRDHLDAAPADLPRVVLAHGLGASLWLHHAAGPIPAGQRVDRVLLVAPPDPDWHEPDVHGFQPTPADPAGIRRAAADTRLVGAGPHIRALAAALSIEADQIPSAGAFDPTTGYGPWPAVLAWVQHNKTPLTACT